MLPGRFHAFLQIDLERIELFRTVLLAMYSAAMGYA